MINNPKFIIKEIQKYKFVVWSTILFENKLSIIFHKKKFNS